MEVGYDWVTDLLFALESYMSPENQPVALDPEEPTLGMDESPVQPHEANREPVLSPPLPSRTGDPVYPDEM